MDTYILNINNLKSISLEKDGKIIHTENFEDGVISKKSIDDILFVKYLFNKTLAFMENSDNLLIRYFSDENLFRYENVDNLKDKEVINYINYNIEEIFPDKENFYLKKYNYMNNQIYLYAIPNFIVEFLKNIIYENNIKSYFMTNFVSEFISSIDLIKEDNFQALNIQDDYIEIVTFENKKVLNYKIKKTYMLNLDIDDITNKNRLENFYKMILENIDKDLSLYYFGNDDYINLFELASKDKLNNKTKLDLDYNSYFKRDNETGKLFRR